MPFTFLNDPETSAPMDQVEPDARDFEIMLAAHSTAAGSGYGAGPTGVQSQLHDTSTPGCAVTAQGTPDQTVAVAAGSVRIGGRYVKVTAGNVSLTAADGTNPRFDLITVDTTGTKGVTNGTPSADPVYPTLPAGKVILAQVFRAASDNTIQTADITDKRVLIDEPAYENVKWYGAKGDDSTNDQAAIQAALDASTNDSDSWARTRTVFFPRGIYRISTGLTLQQGHRLEGAGKPSTDSRYGSWIAAAASSITMMTVPSGTLRQQGCEIQSLGFTCRDTVTGVTAISISDMNRFRIDNCAFSAPDDTGRMVVGIFGRITPGGDFNWNNITRCEFNKITIGIDLESITGCSIWGCHFVLPPVTNSKGILSRASSTTTTLNVRISDCEFVVASDSIGVHLQGAYGIIVGSHFEGDTVSTNHTGIYIEKVAGSLADSGRRNEIIGNSVEKFAKGVEISTGVTQTSILGIDYVSNTTNFIDNGVATAYIPTTTGEIAKIATALDWPQIAAPAAPASGFHRFYVDSGDTIFKSKDSAGKVSIYGARTRSLFIDGSVFRIDAATGVKLGTPPNAVDGVQLADGLTSGAYCNFIMPVDVIAGTVTIRPIWAPGATDGTAHTVRWQMNIKVLNAADVTAAGTTVAWTGVSAARTVNVEVLETGQASTGVSPAADDRIRLEIQRDGAHANDTYVGAVNLIGVRVDYQANN
jgi:hypothetical protein